MVLTTALIFFYFRDWINCVLDWGEHVYQRKMANNEVKKCMEWLFMQQGEMEEGPMGRGQQNVLKAVAAQKSKAMDICQFRSNVDMALASEKLSEDTKKGLDANFNAVNALSQRREECLETVSSIASLEDAIQGLSIEVDNKAQHLVNKKGTDGLTNSLEHSALLTNETLARASQMCIQAVRSNWQWLQQVMQCAQVHLSNAAAYHQFFHEVSEAEYWMTNTLSRIHLSFDRSKLQGNRTDAEAILAEIKDVLSAFLQWQTKTDYLFDKAKNVVPVPYRTSPLTEERPVLALADFSNAQITFIEGETLFLVDNEDRMKWKVRNNEGQTGIVPAVIILIPAPYMPATDIAIRLRLQLVALWTASVKRLGYQLIAFMLLVFRDWTEEEVALLQRLSQTDREELLRVLHYLETTLQDHWHQYGDFQELQERIHRLIMILEESRGGHQSDSEFLRTVVVQIHTLEELLKKYKDFWTFWETYKTIVELIRQPQLLLVCDKWEQLRFVTTAHMVKFWDTNLDLTDGDLTKQTASLALQETPSDGPLVTDVTIDEDREDTTTETVSTSVTEEQHTFIIKGVLDPRDNQSTLDLQQAIVMGIVDQGKNLYVNPLTGESMTMQNAMSEGKLIIEFLSKKKLREEKKSYGLITITHTHETRPYTIHGVKDPKTDKMITVEEATHSGILDVAHSAYHTQGGDSLSLHDAIELGLLDVSYHADHPHPKPEVVSKTYAVYGIVDQLNKTKVSFTDALSQGLLDRESGEYVHNVSGEKFPVQQAIMRGFIKARLVKDPSKLEVDPRNQIVVKKLEHAKQTLLREMRTIRMFKSMAKH